MDSLLIVLLLAVGVVAVIYQVHRGRLSREAWRRTAARLGLRTVPGSLFKSTALEGNHQGVAVRVDTFTRRTGKSSTRYTRFRVRYPSLDLGLNLKAEGFFSGVTKFLGAPDVRVGHSDFDDRVLVRGHRPEELRRFLTAERRMRILRAFAQHRQLLIGDSELQSTVRGIYTSAERFEGAIRGLCRLARCLVDEPRAEAPVARGLEARELGELDAALERVRAAQPPPEQEAEEGRDPDARVLESEILLIGRRYGEAALVLEAVHREQPEDEEVEQLAREARRREARPARAPEAPADPGGEAPDADPAAAAEALFAPGLMSFDTARVPGPGPKTMSLA